jgi:hypothetical protein
MAWVDRGASSTLRPLALAGFRAHRDATHSVTAAIGAGTTHPVKVNHRAVMMCLLSVVSLSRATRVPRAPLTVTRGYATGLTAGHIALVKIHQ